MKKKVVSVLVSALMVSTMLAGCTGAAGGKTEEAGTGEIKAADKDAEKGQEEKENGDGELSGELNIVHYIAEAQKLKALDDMVDGFNKEYPDVKVNLESTTLDNYQDVVKLKISTGDAPDILFGSCKTYSDLVNSGNIEDLTDQEFTARIDDSVIDNVSIDGKVYSIPLDQLANAVYYNKDIFEELKLDIPTTYSEFIETCRKLKDAGYIPCAAGYQDGISVGANFYTIFYGTNYLQCENHVNEMVNGEKKAEDYPSLARALEQWREIMEYQNDDQKTINTDRAEQIFANGEAGMIIIGTWGLGAITQYNPEGNYGAFMFPSEEKAEDNTIPIAAGDCWMAVKDSPNHEAAMAFCEYMTRGDVNAQWCATTQEISMLKDVKVPSLPQASQDVADIVASGKVSNYNSINSFAGLYYSAWGETLLEFAVTEDMSVEQFCKELDNRFAAADK